METSDFILRILIAALLGSAIGLEREYRAKEAGFRTHFLVALGSALFMIVSMYGFDTILNESPNISVDPSRIASQVVTGIGFIGAGTIIFQKHVVRGLTTAAGLWVTAAIGLTIGAGMYELGVAATVLVLLCLEALNFILRRIGSRNITLVFSSNSQDKVSEVVSKLEDNDVEIDSYEMQAKERADGMNYTVTMGIKIRRKNYQNYIREFLRGLNEVSIETIE